MTKFHAEFPHFMLWTAAKFCVHQTPGGTCPMPGDATDTHHHIAWMSIWCWVSPRHLSHHPSILVEASDLYGRWLKIKGMLMNKTICVIFNPLRSPPPLWMDLHRIWYSPRGRRHSHLWQIFRWLVEGCRFCAGVKNYHLPMKSPIAVNTGLVLLRSLW